MDVNTLVQLLVATALVDQSAPPCWRLNELLGAIERLVMVTLSDCAGYAKIAGLALAELGEKTANPAVKALLKLAMLNGRRRCDEEDALSIQTLFDEVSKEIDELEKGPRRDRCYSFFLYQQQVFGARCGFYAQASKAAEAAVGLSAKPEEKAISLYLARVYAMWSAIVSGTQERIDAAFAVLWAELLILQQAVAGTALEVQWGKGNGPIHLLQAMTLACINNDALWDENMAVVLANEATLGDAFRPGIQVLKLEDARRHGRNDEVVQGVSTIFTDDKPSLATKAWTRLISARTYVSLGFVAEDFHDYKVIKPVPDAHVVAAVAARELAALSSP
jgi:hypothetical protein